jgi:hypothetical protein
MSEHSGGTNPFPAPERLGTGSTAATGTKESSEPDWTKQVTDLIVDTVDKVRDKTTGPILDVSRGSVHAVVAAMLLLPVLVLFVIGTIRLLNWAIPGDVWIIYAGLGAILTVIGLALWSKRAPS